MLRNNVLRQKHSLNGSNTIIFHLNLPSNSTFFWVNQTALGCSRCVASWAWTTQSIMGPFEIRAPIHLSIFEFPIIKLVVHLSNGLLVNCEVCKNQMQASGEGH